ncbi:hypothetical protein Tco_0030917 [Tanacetum coccineum]
MFDLELLTPSMNYIPVRKENYADLKEQGISCDDDEDLDFQQFHIIMEQVLHDELVSLMHQESLAKLHNDAQRNAFEEEKKRIALDKGKECVDSTFTLKRSVVKQPPGFLKILLILTRSTELSRATLWPDIKPQEHDDIIFGIYQSSMVKDFEELIKRNSRRVQWGEAHFLLGLSSQANFLLVYDWCVSLLKCFNSIPDIIFCLSVCKISIPHSKGLSFHLEAFFPPIVTILGTIMIDYQLQEDVNILEETGLICNARNKQLWLTPLQKSENVAASKLLWSQSTLECKNNSLIMDYNFMNTEIHIDNLSTICIVKILFIHSKDQAYSDSTSLHSRIFNEAKAPQNADIIKSSTFSSLASSLTTRLLVDPDLIGPWLQQFWATATLQATMTYHTYARKEVVNSIAARKNIVLVLILGLQVLQGMLKAVQLKVLLILNVLLQYKVLLPSMVLQQTHDSVKFKLRDTYKKKQTLRSKRDKNEKHRRKKVSSVKYGRIRRRELLSEDTMFKKKIQQHPFLDDIVDKDAAGTPDLERKSDETEEVNIEEKEASNVKSGETEELDLETTQSTANRDYYPRTLILKSEADFEKNAQDKESLEGISMITELQVIDSPDGEYLIIHRANNHFRAFDTLWEILHVLDRQDLYHLYRVVDDYYEHIPPTGLGLSLLGDLNIIWETAESSDDDFWKDQEEWEIIRWRFHESSGVHTLEIEDGTMIHMLAERRYPLSRELMIRMLEHGMEVENESETAITLIHLFILWTTANGDNS